MKVLKVSIKERKEVAKDTVEISLDLKQQDFPFEAGQYLRLTIPELHHPDPQGNYRDFSIASSPNNRGTLQVVMRKSESGFKKTLSELPMESRVEIMGPRGSSFVLSKNNRKTTVFIAGGTGIAPFISVLRNEIELKSKRRMILFYLNEIESRAAYVDELKEIASLHTNFTLSLFFGKLKLASLWKFIKEHSREEIEWYVGGPQGMVDRVGNALIRAKISANAAHYEENYPAGGLNKNSNVKDIQKSFATLEMFRMAVSQASNHIIFTDENGKIKFANKAAEVMTGYSFAEMQNQTPRLWGGLMEQSFYENFWQTIKKERKPISVNVHNRKKNGLSYTVILKASPIISYKNKLVGFVGIEEDITELERIYQVKKEFIDLASHQLRTPLTSMQWTAELFAKNEKLTDKGKEYLKDIESSMQRLNALIKLLLNVSRIEGGKVEVKPKSVEVVSVINEFLKKYAAICEKKQLIISFSERPVKLEAVTDQNLLEQIIQNIFGNSIDYTTNGGEIKLLLKKKKDTFLLAIHNTGQMIPKKDQEHIFQKFFRASNAVAINPDGTGLGLYIVSEAVKLLGGKIWFESEEGKGTIFYTELPMESKAKAGKKTLVDHTGQ